MRKIAIGSLAQESNSFSPIPTTLADFSVLRGGQVLRRYGDVANILRTGGFGPVPLIDAYALPGGPVLEGAYLALAGELIEAIPPDVEGLWLMLHGSLYVQGIESGETHLLREIRKKLGRDVPVAVTMDMHASHTPEYIGLIDIVRGFHTAPHEDADYARCRRMTAHALLEMLGGRAQKSFMRRVPLLLPGETFMTPYSPAREAVALTEEIEAIPGVTACSIFAGMAWSDFAYNTASVVLTADAGFTHVDECLDRVVDFLLAHRGEYGIAAPHGPLEEALERVSGLHARPYFISDSGDNVTAGAVGDNALCLRALLEAGLTGCLVAGLWDAPFVDAYFGAEPGTRCDMPLGASMDVKSTALEGVTGTLVKSLQAPVGNVPRVRLALVEYGGNRVIACDTRCAFTEPGHISQIAGDPADYAAVIVKLGYLYPDLAVTAAESFIALTPGNCSLDLTQLPYRHVRPGLL